MIAFRRCDFFCEELLPLVVLSHALLTYLWCLFRISYGVCAKTLCYQHPFTHFSCEFFTTDDVFRKRLFVSITNLEQAGILTDTFSGLLTTVKVLLEYRQHT